MSTQPFSFPPPPPPPPKRGLEIPYQPNQGNPHNTNSSRGGGFHRGATRGGRGSRVYGHTGPYGATNNPPHHSPNRPVNDRPYRNSGLNPPQKRNHAHAFHGATPPRPQLTAAPAVPSFNASIEHLLPPKPVAKPASQKQEKPRTHNVLGLTPAGLDHESDPEDDENEESRLATQTQASSQGLEFEYRGHTSALRTVAEVAAWLAERKKRYPTQAKVEIAKKEAEERKRKSMEERKARLASQQEAQAQRNEERRQRQEQLRKDRIPEVDLAIKAQLKADKLKKKAQKIQRQVAEAEEALRIAQEKRNASSQEPAPIGPLEHEATHISSGSDPSDSDATSSSGSSTTDSDSDSDSSPEVVSTKRSAFANDMSPPPPSNVAASPAVPRLCKNVAKFGRCKYGSKCRFSHDLATKRGGGGGGGQDKNLRDSGGHSKPGRSGSDATSTQRRKGLWQVMVEKEQKEERRRMLGAIITLGERGMLDEPEAKSEGSG